MMNGKEMHAKKFMHAIETLPVLNEDLQLYG